MRLITLDCQDICVIISLWKVYSLVAYVIGGGYIVKTNKKIMTPVVLLGGYNGYWCGA